MKPMTITDEMTEAALVKWFNSETTWHVGLAPWTAEQFRSEMKEALSAALSVPAEAVVGEPVAWMFEGVGWGKEVMLSHKDALERKERLSATWDITITPLYADHSAPEGWLPDAGQQWFLDRIGEEITAGRKQNALTYLSCVFAEISQRQKAIDKVLAAEADFRSNMPADWQGDPLSDAVAELRKALGGASHE